MEDAQINLSNTTKKNTTKGLCEPKEWVKRQQKQILLLFTCPHVVPNPYAVFFSEKLPSPKAIKSILVFLQETLVLIFTSSLSYAQHSL